MCRIIALNFLRSVIIAFIHFTQADVLEVLSTGIYYAYDIAHLKVFNVGRRDDGYNCM